jgi:dTDP-4-amino-4,6-dideoxygalactose transaminase
MDSLVRARLTRIGRYRERLGALSGCRLQEYPPDRTSSGNYFVLFVGDGAKRTRDEVCAALKASGIQTKRYFYPPVHEQAVFRRFPMRVSATMPQTLAAAAAGMALPLYSHMTEEEIDTVCRQVERLLA